MAGCWKRTALGSVLLSPVICATSGQELLLLLVTVQGLDWWVVCSVPGFQLMTGSAVDSIRLFKLLRKVWVFHRNKADTSSTDDNNICLWWSSSLLGYWSLKWDKLNSSVQKVLKKVKWQVSYKTNRFVFHWRCAGVSLALGVFCRLNKRQLTPRAQLPKKWAPGNQL